MWLLRFSVVTICLAVTGCQLTTDMDKLLNWCLDAKHHKTRPGKEDQLHKQCTPWAEKACCTANTTRNIHAGNMYGLNFDHCPGHHMSQKCRKHFVRDHCFYECSPNIGPWVVQVTMHTRNERFYKVPLCASSCIDWFEDCINDFTCTDNWSRNFVWRNGTSHCPAGSQCYTFGQVYRTARNFCQTVWDHSWQYTEDDQPCMQVWFQPGGGNPNTAVAQMRAQQLAAAASQSAADWTPLLLTLLSLLPLLWGTGLLPTGPLCC